MGLIEKIRASRAESRAIGGVPWKPWDSPFSKFSAGGPAHPTRSFYGVDEALGLPALYAGCRLLADSVASLPLNVYTKAGSGGRTIRYNGPSIFDAPSATGTLFDWLFTCMTSLILQGNAWGYITGYDGYGLPTGIEWLPPEDVTCVDDEMQPWNPMRTRIYVYGRLVDRTELFHVKAFSLAGRTEGISPLRAFALTILAGTEAQRYGTDWYRAGGFPPGTFQNNEIEIDGDQAEQIRSMLTATIRRREPLVYGRDWDYKPVTVPPSEAQFIDAMRLNATHIAAILGLPPDRLGGTRGDSMTYSTVEQNALQVIEAMRPYLVRLEHAFFRLLPQNRYTRFNADALLKTDLKTRTEIYQIQRNIGLRTTDEIRDLEDLEPLTGSTGNEPIPLVVMEAMARSIRGIPNSMLPQITLEMDLAAAKLEQLQKEGIAAQASPDDPPVPAPQQMLGQLISSMRSHDGAPDLRDVRDISAAFRQLGIELPGEIIASLAREYGRYAPHKRHAGLGAWGRPDPEFVGAWIPSPRETVLAGVNGHDGPRVNGSSNGYGGET